MSEATAEKHELTAEELHLFEREYGRDRRVPVLMWLLWFFTGGIGGHRYYLRDYAYAIVMTVTLGGLGIWSLVDAILIHPRLKKKNKEIEEETLQNIIARRS